MLAVIFFSLAMASTGCTDSCNTTRRYISYEPVYMTTDEVRSAFEFQVPRDLNVPGKIYLYGQYLLVNEIMEGVHIINNQDPSNPQKVGFINIPGNVDMAVKDNILYADSYVDLLAIDITDVNNPTIVKRVESVFEGYNTTLGFWPAENDQIIVEWEKREVVEFDPGDCLVGGDMIIMQDRVLFGFGGMEDAAVAAAPGPGGGTGIGGSMARFTVVEDYLYTVGSWNLKVFDITAVEDPQEGNEVYLDWGIETIFPFKDKLFIGANNGMHIYDLTDPFSPSHVSTFLHVTSCDPVVANDNYAFVTLRSGTECQGFTNQLDLIDITDITNPSLIESFPMANPHGLGLDKNTLFVTEGEAGLKVFDVTVPEELDENMIIEFSEMHGFDVIPFQNVLMMIGADGLYQYDYSDLQNIVQLSHIEIIPVPNE